MARLEVASDKQHFTCDGKSFFWVGDTVWSAFTNPTFDEWQEYLTYRKTQGFNGLQINTLPQWDRVMPDQGIYPYPRKEDDSLDYSAEPNPAYIERAKTICQMAVDMGFHLALVVDWGNLVPGTWLNRIVPTHVWPLDAIEKHVRRVVEAYDEFEPMYIVSGDTNLDDERSHIYYLRTIEILKELAPKALRTMHLIGEYIDLTPELADGLDFYVYQSGHGKTSVDILDSLPKKLLQRFPGKPVLNAEPCYEAMPKLPADLSQPEVSCFNADEVYDACRRSILAGATAGITYGANGLWNWNRNETSHDDKLPQSLAGGMYAKPMNWREAMMLPGAGRIASLTSLAGSSDMNAWPE